MGTQRYRRLGTLAAAMASAFIGFQLLPFNKPKPNPPIVFAHRIEANLRIPRVEGEILYRACGNCHSNETQWPWYSRVAPFSWAMMSDVERARKVMNFSEWSTKAGRRPELAASMLLSVCADVQKRRMPSATYLMLHPEARVSPTEAQQLCAWTTQEALRLNRERRNGLRLVGTARPLSAPESVPPL